VPRPGDLGSRRARAHVISAALPLHRRASRLYAPLYPLAFEAFDLRAFDVIVSSTTAWAKGVKFRPDAVHICYINTVLAFRLRRGPLRGRLRTGRARAPRS